MINDTGRTIIKAWEKESIHSMYAPYISVYQGKNIVRKYHNQADMVFNVMVNKGIIILSKSGKAARLCRGLEQDFVPSVSRSFSDFDLFCEMNIFEVLKEIESVKTYTSKALFVSKYYFNGFAVSEGFDDLEKTAKYWISDTFINKMIACDSSKFYELTKYRKERDIINAKFREAAEVYYDWYRRNKTKVHTKAELDEMQRELEKEQKEAQEEKDRIRNNILQYGSQVSEESLRKDYYANRGESYIDRNIGVEKENANFCVTFDEIYTWKEYDGEEILNSSEPTKERSCKYFSTKEEAEIFANFLKGVYMEYDGCELDPWEKYECDVNEYQYDIISISALG